MTQLTVAEAIGISHVQICKWEIGTGSPRLQHAIKLRSVFPDLDIAMWGDADEDQGPVPAFDEGGGP